MPSRRRHPGATPLVQPHGIEQVGDRVLHFFAGGEHWTNYHASVFLLTFFSFALIHASRKTLSTVKSSLVEIWTHNTTGGPPIFPDEKQAQDFLALLDCGFLGTYAIGLFIGGYLGDRFDPARVLAIGMWLSASVAFAFGYLTEFFHVYSKPLYLLLWLSGGLFQSVAWPAEVCIMGNWFGHGSRGAVMGLWSACASVGNIIGTLITSHLVGFGYQYAFAVNCGMLFLFAFLVFFNLHPAPRDVGLPDPIETRDELTRVVEAVTERPKPISFWKAWLLPGVIAYSLAYACLKLVNYSFFFWLPFYLQSEFKWPEAEADSLSTWYDVGGIVAAILAGIVSDHFSSRTPIIYVMLVVSTPVLWIYSKSPDSQFVNGVLLAIAGFFIGGPANMISSAVSADLGKAPELHGSTEALSTVTGIVDGTGSTGAAIGQLLVPWMQQQFGWDAVFVGFIVMMLSTSAFLTPLLCRELESARRRAHYRSLSQSTEGEGGGEREGLLGEDDNHSDDSDIEGLHRRVPSAEEHVIA